ncbi:hypothetical protein F5887DRAFT_1063270 [Amanita rubescens]|nr:hypothetical protein F5887DRAFT_1063270 [Amanita rubescens]
MFLSLRCALLLPFHLLALQPSFSAAYSWILNAPATQCSNLSITITGSDGTPPYSVLVVPFGPTPLPNSAEVRTVIVQPFDGDSTTTSFAINYPADSQFVAVVSDARGFGTGGTSVAMKVSNSGDSSCLSTHSLPFYYFVGSDNQFTQCEASRIWWVESTVQGTPSFDGIIPGGQSFVIPESGITQTSSEGTGFSWTPPIQAETTLIVVAGDDRGMGSGGSAIFSINYNIDTSCLNALSPSSTPGLPAGSYATSAAASSASSTSNTNANANANANSNTTTTNGEIVGGGIGGFLILAVGALYYFLQRNSRRTGQIPTRDHPLSQYSPEPFAEARHTSENVYQWESGYSSTPLFTLRPSEVTSMSASGSGSGSGGYNRTSDFGSRIDPPLEVPGSQREPCDVNVIQHEDSGVTLLLPTRRPIVELPPRYDKIGAQDRPNLEVLLGSQNPL